MKDAQLDRIAELGLNVARFISVSPNGSVRFARIEPGGNAIDEDLADLVEQLFASGVNSVNIRSFTEESSQGNPFDYGIVDINEAVSVARKRLSEGYFVIINETVDIHDGGVSGVSEGGIWEFSPNATPRVVETGEVCRLPTALAARIINIVYGATVEFAANPSLGHRVEFSIHPIPVGYRRSRTLIWEISESSAQFTSVPTIWPNPFSMHLGDKTFGLLVADAIGLRVPATLALPRHLPPFRFGSETGSDECWTRTAPVKPKPGLFTTVKGWTDVFRLMAEEDPDGSEIASVLQQQGVAAKYSGAAIPQSDDGEFLIEGVAGDGDAFMLGDAPPVVLPAAVTAAVAAALRTASETLGPVRMEWVHDGSCVWVVQMHRATQAATPGVFYPGTPENGWLEFSPAQGLSALSAILEQARQEGRGIQITTPVGVTSHVGDLIRRSAVPAIMAWS